MPNIVYMLQGGMMRECGVWIDKDIRQPLKANFVICCVHGDWSGFRTLAECQRQFPELEARNKPDGYFWVEER